MYSTYIQGGAQLVAALISGVTPLMAAPPPLPVALEDGATLQVNAESLWLGGCHERGDHSNWNVC